MSRTSGKPSRSSARRMVVPCGSSMPGRGRTATRTFQPEPGATVHGVDVAKVPTGVAAGLESLRTQMTTNLGIGHEAIEEGPALFPGAHRTPLDDLVGGLARQAGFGEGQKDALRV